jgi:hypothetical protein
MLTLALPDRWTGIQYPRCNFWQGQKSYYSHKGKDCYRTYEEAAIFEKALSAVHVRSTETEDST